MRPEAEDGMRGERRAAEGDPGETVLAGARRLSEELGSSG